MLKKEKIPFAFRDVGVDPSTLGFEGSEVGVYYHLTPTSKVSSISKRGLVPSVSPTLGLPELKEITEGRIYLGRNIDECGDQVWANEFLTGKLPTLSWTLLKVRIPEEWISGMDGAGYLYTTNRIPSEAITNLGRFPIEGFRV